MKSKIIVIGGLAAGPAAASKAKRISPDSEVVLFEQSEYISYGICELPYYINNKIYSYQDLILFTPEKFEQEKNVIVKTNHSVREIIPHRKEITVLDLKKETLIRENYDKLIIATGSKIIKHPDFISDAKNVFYLKTLSDAIEIRKFIEYKAPKKVTIIGSGFVALEMADSFSSIGIEVIMLGFDDLPGDKFEPETRRFILERLKKKNVKYIKYEKLKSAGYDLSGNVNNVLIDDLSIETDFVFISIGIVPNTDLAKNARISMGKMGGILVDTKMCTNISNIYAAGDCCEIKNPLTNRYSYNPFASYAQKTGWAAGENAAGGNSLIKNVVSAYTLSFLESEIAHVGLTYKEAVENNFQAEKVVIDGWARPRIFPGAEKIGVLLIYDKRDYRLLGGEIFGRDGAAHRANILSTAIYEKLTLKDLLNLDFAYHPASTPQRDPLLICASKALKNT